MLTSQRAATTAFREKIAGFAGLRNVSALAQRESKRVFPDGRPGRSQDVAQRFVVRLAGDDLPIRFDAHIVVSGGAAFDAKVELERIEVAILGRGVPDQALPALLRKIRRNFKQVRQVLLSQPGVDRAALA